MKLPVSITRSFSSRASGRYIQPVAQSGNTKKVTITSSIKRIILIFRINIRAFRHSPNRLITLRTKIVVILVVGVIFAFCQCKSDKVEEYSYESIALDNVQAALYFHTIFREVEYAWAFVDDAEYEKFEQPEKWTTADKNVYKELTYDGEKATITYYAWVTADNLLLVGTIIVDIAEYSYRSTGKIASVLLQNFSIQGQDISGGNSKIQLKCQNVESNENDIYSFSNITNVAIHEEGYNKPVLISASISNGQYERIAGSDTFKPDDDVWAYWGTMTGTIHEDPKLKYTNIVAKDNAINYNIANCEYGAQGEAKITIQGRSDIVCKYNCTGVEIEVVQLVN